MKHFVLQSMIGIATLCPLVGVADSAEERFAAARTAYDSGQYADALAHYDRLIADGWRLPEIYFNRGNALVRSGRIGEAIASYELARLLSPRDADITANLRFVRTQAGLPMPPRHIWDSACAYFTVNEWTWAALVGWWMGSVLLAVRWLLPKHANKLGMAAGAAFLLLTVSAGGLYYHLRQTRHPLVIVTQTGKQALFAPLAGATPHFDTQEGTALRLQSDNGEWLQVSDGKRVGWIPATACRIVRLADRPRM